MYKQDNYIVWRRLLYITCCLIGLGIGLMLNQTPLMADVRATYPTAGSTSVGIDESMIIYFDEEVDADTINNSNIVLTETLTGIPVSCHAFQYHVVGGKTTLKVDPVNNLSYNTEYTLSLTSLTDINWNMIADYTFGFTTVDYSNRLQLTSVNPEDGAVDVPINTSIILTFNKNVASSSVNNNTVYLTEGIDKIPATLTLNNSTSTARLTITPTSSLAYLTTYEINIINSINGAYALRDLEGQTMEAVMLSFTTRAATDQAPTIVSRTPAAYSANISPDTMISVTFNQDMDPATLNKTNITLLKNGSNVSIQPIVYNSGTRTINIIPVSRLETGVRYTVKLSASVKGDNGIAITADSWYFNTISTNNNTPTSDSAYIVNQDPAAGASGVALNKVVRFQFSASMNSSTINSSTVYLSLGGSVVSGTVTYDSNTNWVSITPTSQLVNNNTYTVNVSSNIKDINGNNISSTSWVFSTGTGSSNIGSGYADPYPNSTGVAVDKEITYRFTTTMNASTINRNNVYLTYNGTSVSCSVSYNASNYLVTIIPYNDMRTYTTYTVTLSGNIQDNNGNYITPIIWSFTTGYDYDYDDEDDDDDDYYYDNDNASVFDRTPDNHATGVALDKVIRFRFDKTMRSSTINDSNIYLTRSGSRVYSSVSYDSSSRTVTITPNNDLEPNTEYKVVINGNVRDNYGYYVNNSTWTFRTRGSSSSSAQDTYYSSPQGTPEHPVIMLNGQYVNFTDVEPYIKNGRTFLPYRALLEALGAETINWDSKLRKVTATLDDNRIELTIGYKVIVHNGQTYLMDVAPEIKNNRTMVPLRFVSEALGFNTDWDSDNYVIYLSK